MIVAYHNLSYVCGVEGIHVLVIVYGIEDCFFVDMLWKGELTEDTVNGIVAVELSDKLKSVLSISADVKLMEPGSIERSQGKGKHVIDKRKLV